MPDLSEVFARLHEAQVAALQAAQRAAEAPDAESQARLADIYDEIARTADEILTVPLMLPTRAAQDAYTQACRYLSEACAAAARGFRRLDGEDLRLATILLAQSVDQTAAAKAALAL